MKKLLNDVNIIATDIPDAWFQCIYNILGYGGLFSIDRGSFAGDKRLEFDHITVHIINPGYGSDEDVNNLLPKMAESCTIPPPVENGYLDNYLSEYLMHWILKADESYTYGQRLTRYEIPIDWKDNYKLDKNNSPDGKDWREILIQEKEYWDDPNIITFDSENDKCFVNQIELLKRTYRDKGFRNNQMVLQVASPSDLLLQDPPCLREIDTRIQMASDGNVYLHFFPEMRSWDLWGGFPANLAGFELLKQLIVADLQQVETKDGLIDVQNGSIIARSKGLHLYSYVIELAEAIANKSIDEAKSLLLA